MRMHPILLLVAGLTMAACDDGPGPSTAGTLVVSTSTGGSHPDHDGYLLTVDGLDSLALDPTGSAQVDLPPGRHTLRLLGVAAQCAVSPGTSLRVDVLPENTTPVAFVISCPGTNARITAATAGADIDPDGYRVMVDGTDRGVIPSNGTLWTRLEPGSWTIDLTGLTPNCAVDGPTRRTVTIVDFEVAPIEFSVVCTATSGVLAISISGTDIGTGYSATVDEATPFSVWPNEPAYLSGVAAGDHVVSLSAPGNCSVENNSQSVTVTTGGLIRDTIEVTFSLACVWPTLRITAPTTGAIPEHNYSVWICGGYYCFYYFTFLGTLDPTGTLLAQVVPDTYFLELRDLPSHCRVLVSNPTGEFSIAAADTLDVEFPVACSP